MEKTEIFAFFQLVTSSQPSLQVVDSEWVAAIFFVKFVYVDNRMSRS